MEHREAAAAQPTEPLEAVTVYYDGACPLCAAEIALYRRQDPDGRLSLVDVAQPHAALPPGLSRQAALARFHVLDAHGELRSGAAAFAALWRALPRWRMLGQLAGTRWMSGTLEGLYRLFLPVRPFLSGVARGIMKGRDR